MYAEFNVSDTNDAIEWKGEVVRFHTLTESDIKNSLMPLKKGMPILLAWIRSYANATPSDTNEPTGLFSLWLDTAIVIDAFGNEVSFDDIPTGANICVIGFGHLGLDGIIDGDLVEHLRNVRLIKLLGN